MTVNPESNFWKINSSITDHSGYSVSPIYNVDNTINFGDGIKWYTHNEDCLKVSREHPETTFVIYGLGEDENDNWMHVFCNGEVVKDDSFTRKDMIESIRRAVTCYGAK